MRKLWVLLLSSLVCVSAFGHDMHDHAGIAGEELGKVHFPVSCASAESKAFERGVALLHSFWYEEAAKQFEAIAKQDPHCAMAHWGIAMSSWHELWNHPDEDTIKAGRQQVTKAEALHAKTARERAYIAAMRAFYAPENAEYQVRANAYSEQMEKVYKQYPDDQEGAAFYALALLASEPEGDMSFANRKKAAAVLEPLFASGIDHPGVAHYLIHAYDKPQLAEQGLAAARRYAKIAPASAHAVHMPSHIFARMGLWQDDINSNLSSIAITRKASDMHMGGAGHQFHAMGFLLYAYLQTGRDGEAQNLIEQVRLMPKMEDSVDVGYDVSSYAKAEFPAIYDLEMHHFADAAALQPVPGANDETDAITFYARAVGAARSGNVQQARADVAKLQTFQQKASAEKKLGLADAIAENQKMAQAWIDHAEGNDTPAIASLRSVAEKTEATGDEPGSLPAREMLADMLMEMKHPEQALAEYQTDLKFNPNRFGGLYGAARAAEMAGKTDQANTYYAQLVKVCSGSSSDRPELQHARELVAKE